MEERIAKFIAALRAGGVRVSLAESQDAFQAIEALGVRKRDVFRLSLRSTLIKDSKDIPVFEELFPLFFDSQEAPPLMDMTKDLTPEETKMLEEALRQFTKQLREMLERLMRGEELSQEELDQLSKLVGLDKADDMRYREWMVKRMEQALRKQEIQEAIRELMALLEDDTQGLLDQPLSSLSDRDLDLLRKEVHRLSAILRTRIALRQKRAKSGHLDAKATIRANLKHGSIPFDVKHRDRTLKPKLVVICDISTSMRPVSEFMLNLLYAMQDQISKTHAFAFIDHLEFISPDFETKEAKEAVNSVLERMPSGYYNTDLGGSLETFSEDYMDKIDGRTVFIMVGDGRNNYNDPRTDLFKEITRRSRRTIWLTPESPALWGTGDSDMLKYASYCDMILQVSTMAELAEAVNQLMSS